MCVPRHTGSARHQAPIGGNPGNWDNGLPDKSVNTYIQNFAPINWPVLDGGAAHSALLAIAYEPNMLGELTVTGGALLAVHRDVRIARRSPGGETGTLYIGDPGTCIIGSEDIEVGRWGDATIDMSGGYLCTGSDSYLNLAYHTPSSGTIYLRGGTVEIGAGGLTVGRMTVMVEDNHSITSNRSFIVTRLNNKEPIITEAMFETLGATHVNGAGMTEFEHTVFLSVTIRRHALN